MMNDEVLKRVTALFTSYGYRFGKESSRGMNSVVFEAMTSANDKCAVEIMVSESRSRSRKAKEWVYEERYKNIINLKRIVVGNSDMEKFVLFETETWDTTLGQYIETKGGRLSEEEIMVLFHGVCRGVYNVCNGSNYGCRVSCLDDIVLCKSEANKFGYVAKVRSNFTVDKSDTEEISRNLGLMLLELTDETVGIVAVHSAIALGVKNARFEPSMKVKESFSATLLDLMRKMNSPGERISIDSLSFHPFFDPVNPNIRFVVPFKGHDCRHLTDGQCVAVKEVPFSSARSNHGKSMTWRQLWDHTQNSRLLAGGDLMVSLVSDKLEFLLYDPKEKTYAHKGTEIVPMVKESVNVVAFRIDDGMETEHFSGEAAVVSRVRAIEVPDMVDGDAAAMIQCAKDIVKVANNARVELEHYGPQQEAIVSVAHEMCRLADKTMEEIDPIVADMVDYWRNINEQLESNGRKPLPAVKMVDLIRDAERSLMSESSVCVYRFDEVEQMEALIRRMEASFADGRELAQEDTERLRQLMHELSERLILVQNSIVSWDKAFYNGWNAVCLLRETLGAAMKWQSNLKELLEKLNKETSSRKIKQIITEHNEEIECDCERLVVPLRTLGV